MGCKMWGADSKGGSLKVGATQGSGEMLLSGSSQMCPGAEGEEVAPDASREIPIK